MSRKTVTSNGRTSGAKRPPRIGPVLLAAILLLGGGLRLWRIGEKSLWLDEVMSVRLATMDSLAATVKEVARYDVHPPLYPVLHSLWMRMGSSDGFARVPSAFFGTIAILLVYLLARELYGEPVGLVAALFTALSAYHIYFSQEARQYCLASTLGLLATFLLVKIIQSEKKPSPWLWTAYALSQVLCLYAFAMNVLLLAAHAVIFLVLRLKRDWFPWLICQACVAIAFLPWLPTMFDRSKDLQFIASTRKIPRPGLAAIADAFRSWLAEPMSLLKDPAAVWTLTGVVVFMVVLGLFSHFRHRRVLFLVGTLLFLPLILFVVLPMPRVHIFEAKHVIFLQPLAVLVIASSTRPWRWRTFAAGMVGVLIAVNIISLVAYSHPDTEKEDWHSLAAYVKQSEEKHDLVIVLTEYAPFAFDKYFRRLGGRALIAAWPEVIPGTIEKMLPKVKRIWFVVCINKVTVPLPPPPGWLRDEWKPEEEYFRNFPGLLGTLAAGLYARSPQKETRE